MTYVDVGEPGLSCVANQLGGRLTSTASFNLREQGNNEVGMAIFAHAKQIDNNNGNPLLLKVAGVYLGGAGLVLFG